jgi:hypothetical protein
MVVFLCTYWLWQIATPKPETNDRTLKHCQTILKGEMFKGIHGDLLVLRPNISTLTVMNNQLEFILKELKKKSI